MDINNTATMAARTRIDDALRAATVPSLICAHASMESTGEVDRFDGGRVFGVSDIKPFGNADNPTGTDWSPPV